MPLSNFNPEMKWILFVVAIIAVIVSILKGPEKSPIEVTLTDLLKLFSGKMDRESLKYRILVNIRLPRALIAFMVGAILSISGMTFQALLHNPLADPFTLGVSSGAAFGASLALVGGGGVALNIGHISMVSLFAFIGGIISLILVFRVSSYGATSSTSTIILAGIIVSTFFSAMIGLIKTLNEESVSTIVFWLMGSFSAKGWNFVLILFPFAVVGIGIIYFLNRCIDILATGERTALSLGIDVNRMRPFILTVATLITAVAVSCSGIIGFVGLIVPHGARLLFGASHNKLTIPTVLIGGAVMVCSDLLARIILPGGEELPVGIVSAIYGAPLFAIIMRKRIENLK